MRIRNIFFVFATFVTRFGCIGAANNLQYKIADFLCRSVTDTGRITLFLELTLDERVEQCFSRGSCQSLVYKRRVHVCELFRSDVSTSPLDEVGTSCVLVRKEGISVNTSQVQTIRTSVFFVK